MVKGTILLTGGTGFIGSAILIAALRAGYNIHIVVRSEARAEYIKRAPAMLALGENFLCRAQFFIVPDFAVPGSLDKASRGADFVIHCAAPLPFGAILPERYEEELVRPGVKNVLSALESARHSGTVKRFISLSSLGAFVVPELLVGPYDPPEEITITEESLSENFVPPYNNSLTAYCAGKTAALRQSLDWMRDAMQSDEGLGFDLVNMAPTYVYGRQILAETAADLLTTSNVMLLRSATGNATSDVLEFAGGCHLDDIVEAHLKALDKGFVTTPIDGHSKGIETFIFGMTFKWDDVNKLVSKSFPTEVEKGLLPNRGYFASKSNLYLDTSKAESRLGIKSKSLKDMVEDTVNHYLELLETK